MSKDTPMDEVTRMRLRRALTQMVNAFELFAIYHQDCCRPRVVRKLRRDCKALLRAIS
jgi:hypothetical protein